MTEHADQTHPNDAQTTRVTVAEAAKLLGLSAEAVRSRVQRETLKSTKENGTVYVLLDADLLRPSTDETDAHTHLGTDQTEFIASLQDQIDWLRREVERKDTLLMSLMQRIPELDAPQEPRESPEAAPDLSPSRDAQGEEAAPETPASSPWWKRIFGA